MDSDYIFKAFIVNRFEYDNGNKETSGAWLYFPTDKETAKRTLEEIGLPSNAGSNQYFIDEYKCGNNDLEKFLSIDSDIDELNYLANRISELEDIEMTVFQTAIQTKECQSIKDAINITYNTECFDIISDMGSWKNIGAYIAERNGFGIELIGDLANYIDYATYGRAYANDNGGYFVDDIYLEKNSAKLTEKYNGSIEDIPNEYRVTVPTEPQKMTVIIVPPMQEPYTKEIGTELKDLQREVGGNIEVLYPFAEKVGLICNEEGKNIGLDLNRALYDAEGKIYDIIAGTFVLVGLGAEDFTSLPPEQIDALSKQFKSPEVFVKVNGDIKAIPAKPSIKKELKQFSEKGQKQDRQQRKPPDVGLE